MSQSLIFLAKLLYNNTYLLSCEKSMVLYDGITNCRFTQLIFYYINYFICLLYMVIKLICVIKCDLSDLDDLSDLGDMSDLCDLCDLRDT